MLWWDDLMKNLVAMNSNNSIQEGQVEGQVNDQVANDQNVGSQKGDQKKGGLESKSRHFGDYKVSDGIVTFKGFEHEVGTDYSRRINGKLRLGVLDDDLDKVNSYEDLKALLDKEIEEMKESDKNKPSKRSKKTKEELEENLTIALNALMELEPDKSPKDLIKKDQALWEKQRLEKLDQVEKDLTEALDRTKAERQALKANQEQAL